MRYSSKALAFLRVARRRATLSDVHSDLASRPPASCATTSLQRRRSICAARAPPRSGAHSPWYGALHSRFAPSAMSASSSSQLQYTGSGFSSSSPIIHLTEREEVLCQLLHDTCAWIEREHPPLPAEAGLSLDQQAELPLQKSEWRCDARIAGGWPRDKVCPSTLSGHRALVC